VYGNGGSEGSGQVKSFVFGVLIKVPEDVEVVSFLGSGIGPGTVDGLVTFGPVLSLESESGEDLVFVRVGHMN